MRLIELASPNRADVNRTQGDVRGIVIHDTECSFEAAKNTFLAPNSVSAHYLIDSDGTVCRMVDERSVAFHAAAFGNAPGLNRNRPTWLPPYNGRYSAVNASTVGIELAGFASQGFTDAQYDALGELCWGICQRWALAPTLQPDAGAGATIVTHGWLQTDRTDPGSLFDWERLRATMMAASGTVTGMPDGAAAGAGDAEIKGYLEQLGQAVNVDTAIIKRAALAYRRGETRGPALSDEYPATAPDGRPVVRQNFTAGIAEFDPATGQVSWVEVVLHPDALGVAGRVPATPSGAPG